MIDLNAPVVDIVAVLAIAVLGIEWLMKKGWKDASWRHIPGELKWYLLFILSAAVSILFAYNQEYSNSVWHWLRYVVFSYLAYLVVPYLVIDKEKTAKKVLRIWLGVGILVALYGLSSLFIQDFLTHWSRVRPFSIFVWMPLGINHNQLAEVLVAIVPLGVYWSLLAHREKRRGLGLYILATVLMLVICLLTLSRAAWVALAVQAVIAFIFYQKKLLDWGAKNRILVYSGLLVAAMAAGLMLYFVSTSNIVSSSNSARLETTKIVFYYLNYSPFFGFGPGAYTKVLGDTRAYGMDFGEPLEAHGFIQKIMIEEGFVGFSFFALFLIACFAHLWQAQRGYGPGQLLSRTLLIMALGGVVFQLFNTEYFSAVMWMPLGVALAYARLRSNRMV